jgi:hypothetical protein
VREAFEVTAAGLSVLDYGDVAYGRVGPGGEALAPSSVPASEVLSALLGRDDPLDEVLVLLGHDDPRVRMLALVELFDREDPRLLPHLVGRVDDEGAAIPQAARFSSAMIPDGDGLRRVPEHAPPPEPRTVGQVARQLVGFYMERAGFYYGLEGYRDHPGWETYWAERSKREVCASWLLVRHERAHGGVSPLADAAGPRLRGVRALVDALPTGDRELVLLWLPAKDGAFSTPVERMDAARTLGRARLRAILRREPPTDDPDLVPRTDANAGRYPLEGVVRFVLEHAGELLAPEDLPLLLELEAAEEARAAAGDAWPMRTSLWRVAAAELDRENARAHLEQAWAAYQEGDGPEAVLDRMAILDTAWSLLGEQVDDWVAERFWAETQRARYWPYGLTQLVDTLADEGSKDGRRKLAVLLRHPGFESCDWILLEHLARRIDSWTDPDVVGEDELRQARHPFAAQSLATAEGRARAAEQYPDQTRALLDRLAGWRLAIRASMPRWGRGDE